MAARAGCPFAGRIMTQTKLDAAFASMEDDEDARRRYYATLAATELFVILEDEAGETFAPQLLEHDGVTFAVAFDREERLAEFLDAPGACISMSGRALVTTLSDAGLGLGINLGMETGTLLPPDVLGWIAEHLVSEVEAEDTRIDSLGAPVHASEALLTVLDAHLPALTGMARSATLVEATLEGKTGLLLVIVDAPEAARAACAGALAEALRLAQVTDGLDTVFLDADDPVLEAINRIGLRFDIPEPMETQRTHAAPGSDPDKPPILN